MNTSHDQDFEDNPIPQMEYIYRGIHWPRVMAALSILVMVIFAGVQLFLPSKQQPIQANTKVIDHQSAATPSDEPIASDMTLEVTETMYAPQQALETIPETLMPEKPIPEKLMPKPSSDVIAASSDIEQAEEPRTDTTELSPPAESKEEKALQLKSEPLVKPKVTDGFLVAAQQQIRSSKVKAFQLTNGIVDKNPQGEIADVEYDTNDILTLYAWSNVSGMKDEFLHYRWTHNQKEVANVRIGVWSQSWRSYTSKFITQDMRGDWQVELLNDGGELLAEARFYYQ